MKTKITVVVGTLTARGVLVTCVGPNLFRLEEEACLFMGAEEDEDPDSFPNFGDVMLTEPIDADTVRYVSLHTRAPVKRFCHLVPPETLQSEVAAAFLAKIVAEGGHWEYVFGALFIAVPEASEFDPAKVLFGKADET